MSDTRKQAERLVELEEILNKRGWNSGEKMEYELHRQMVTDYARAYLAECEAHERTKEQSKKTIKILDDVLESFLIEGNAMSRHGNGYRKDDCDLHESNREV